MAERVETWACLPEMILYTPFIYLWPIAGGGPDWSLEYAQLVPGLATNGLLTPLPLPLRKFKATWPQNQFRREFRASIYCRNYRRERRTPGLTGDSHDGCESPNCAEYPGPMEIPSSTTRRKTGRKQSTDPA